MYLLRRGRFDELKRLSINSPATELDGESDGELGELEEMRETEFVRDVHAAMREATSTRKVDAVGKVEVTHSLPEWIW